jgi:hypothetical protein
MEAMMRTVLMHPTTRATSSRPPAIVRPPLPTPLPRADRDGVPWATMPTWAIPPNPTRDYLRGNMWGVEMPGAPWVPGGSSVHPERILSWFVDRYALDFQKAYLAKYAGFGYSHFYLSPPDSIQGFGRTLPQFVETCQLVKTYVPYLGIMLGSKVYQAHDMTADAWRAYVDPLLDALLEVGDEFSIWEYDLWNLTAPTAVSVWRHVGERAHAAGKSCWLHFSPHVTSWFKDGDDRGRFGFYDDLGTTINGINYQGHFDWTSQDASDRAVDTLWQFAQQPHGHKFRYWEDIAILQFDGNPQSYYEGQLLADGSMIPAGDPRIGTARGPGMTPEDGDCRGYYLSCVFDNVKHTAGVVWGYGNGGRRPDGSRL